MMFHTEKRREGGSGMLRRKGVSNMRSGTGAILSGITMTRTAWEASLNKQIDHGTPHPQV